MVAAIYGRFTESFDTADLKNAKSLLDELSRSVLFFIERLRQAEPARAPSPSRYGYAEES